MRMISFLLISCCVHLTAQDQPAFKYEGRIMYLVDRLLPGQPTLHTDADQPGEDFRIRLFKDYFNPTSLDAYREFFLPGDWFGLNLEDFKRWQINIAIKKLRLQQVIHLKDQNANEFLVFQYSMESPEYSVYQSTEFKKTAMGWKHTSIQHDPEADFLMRLGSVHFDVDQSTTCIPGKIIDLDILKVDHIRTYEEKFSRADVFKKIEADLLGSGLSAEDIALAKTYFMARDDQSFVEYLSEQSKEDNRKLIERINTSAGFELLRISQNLND